MMVVIALEIVLIKTVVRRIVKIITMNVDNHSNNSSNYKSDNDCNNAAAAQFEALRLALLFSSSRKHVSAYLQPQVFSNIRFRD